MNENTTKKEAAKLVAERIQQLLEDGDIQLMVLSLIIPSDDNLKELAEVAGIKEVAVFGCGHPALK